jgi:putative transposase
MAKIARVVVPGVPHHVAQCGMRSTAVFSDAADRREYLWLLQEQADRFGLSFLAWCLLPNQVHLLAVPRREDSLARVVGETHRLYTLMVNSREDVRGHLFQERFHSYPVQRDRRMAAAARYIETAPVRARLVKRAADWKWPSARYHLGRSKWDPLHCDPDLLGYAEDWREVLADPSDREEAKLIELHLRTGRPLGSESWVEALEHRLGRRLAPKPRGWPKGRKREKRR